MSEQAILAEVDRNRDLSRIVSRMLMDVRDYVNAHAGATDARGNSHDHFLREFERYASLRRDDLMRFIWE